MNQTLEYIDNEAVILVAHSLRPKRARRLEIIFDEIHQELDLGFRPLGQLNSLSIMVRHFDISGQLTLPMMPVA